VCRSCGFFYGSNAGGSFTEAQDEWFKDKNIKAQCNSMPMLLDIAQPASPVVVPRTSENETEV